MQSKLRLGIIGVGARGMRHLKMLAMREDIVFVAIADTNIHKQHEVVNILGYTPRFYSQSEVAYQTMLLNEELDGVLIYTPWDCHLAQSVFAMEQGVPVGLEVGAAFSLEECWAYVEAYERTKTPIMLLENCCYRRDVMAIKNMIQNGLFGEVVHLRGGYRHDIRQILLDEKGNFGQDTEGEAVWRTPYYFTKNADIYPTHGLGPLAQICNINKGNRIVSISSMSSKSVGFDGYVSQGRKAILGDVITSQIKCANGETILLTHDTTLPRPFGLELQIQGTKGIWQDFYRGGNDSFIYLSTNKELNNTEKQWNNAQEVLKKYDAPIWKQWESKTNRLGRYAMDFIMLDSFIQCLKTQSSFPIDVYDLATWKAITPLSEKSIKENSLAQTMPDFIR